MLFSQVSDTLYILKYDFSGQELKSEFVLLGSVEYRRVNILDNNNDWLIFEVDNKLFKTSMLNCQTSFVSENISTACLDNEAIYYLRNNQNGAGLFRNIDSKESIIHSKINVLDNPKILTRDNFLIVITGIRTDDVSEIVKINLLDGKISNSWINANIDKVFANKYSNSALSTVSFISSKNNKFTLNKYDWIQDKLLYSISLSNNSNILTIREIADHTIAIFDNMLMTISDDGEVLSSDNISFNNDLGAISNVFYFNEKLLISGNNQALILALNYNNFWYVNNIFEGFGKYIIPLVLFGFLIIIYRLFLKNKKLLNHFVNETTAGATIIIDKKGRITKMNQSALILLDLNANFNKRKKYSYYLVDEFTKHLKTFVDKSFELKESMSQKILFNEGTLSQEWIFSCIPLFKLTGRFDGIIIKGVDITEELEKNRLHNWSQLAHDMQTNLTTIRLNADQIRIDNPQAGERAGKILNQVNILIQRVRDIVTVGRTNELDLQEYDSADICREVLREFDKTMFPDVIFQEDLTSFKVKCDKPKMIRAIRNAIENGIKSMKDKKGTILLSNSLDLRYYYFKIKDSGIGMDAEVKKKMLTPYFTTASKSGGFGIGTMIMQHVVELHGGELLIESEPNKGTEISFAIPNIYKPKKGAKTIVRKKIT